MNRLPLFTAFFVMAAFSATTIFAQKTSTTCPPTNIPECAPNKPIPTISPGYNAPSRIELDRCWDVFATGSFIYWSPSQANMSIGIVDNRSESNFYLNGTLPTLEAQYQPGFKTGIGMNFDRDKWSGYLEYTWFRSTQNTNISLSASENKVLYPAWQVPKVPISYFAGKEAWHLGMDIFDLNLRRQYYVGKRLFFHPYLGLRSALIRQKLKVDYLHESTGLSAAANAFVRQTTHSWSIGPRTGLELAWDLGCDIRLSGQGSFDVLFTQYTSVKFHEKSTTSTGSITPNSLTSLRQNNINQVRPHFDLDLGLGWGTYFCKKKWHIDLSATYDFQVFFDQNMFLYINDDQHLGKTFTPFGNLYIHGLTTSLRLDF